MTETTGQSLWARYADMPQRDWRNQMRSLAALAAWAVCFVGVSQLIKRELLPEGPISWLAAALPIIAGLVVLVAFARFLREADELQRVIQLQALALGFGGTFFAIAGYRVLERLGAPAAEAANYTLVMAVLYTAGLLLGWRRYR